MPFIEKNILPKTGQISVYGGGDDGFYRAGWDKGQRFIVKTISGDIVILDRATGLMWAKELIGPQSWLNLLMEISSKSWAGFNDWKMPNFNELCSIVMWGRSDCRYNEFKPLALNSNFIFSSTTSYISVYAKTMKFYSGGYESGRGKTDQQYSLYCREYK